MVLGDLAYRGSREFPKPNPLVSTSLLEAAAKGDVEELQRRVNAGERLSQWDERGATPLHYAAKAGRVDSINFLIQHLADCQRGCQLGRTPLHYAARHNQAEAAEALCTQGLSRGLKVDSLDKSEWSALHIAAEKGHLGVVEVLLTHGANYNLPIKGNGWTPLLLAADNAHVQTVERLVKVGANKNALVGKFKAVDFAGRFCSEAKANKVKNVLKK
mmetsp:Transcript_39623/g.55027  ORF Transcript_39623/g.55027 Transcript_39623/m.55027 type:complete len:216 (-) Transcript_39623:227-874(-)|eukprot:CAMPEP_0196587912 /NCGR_PEP_ID=MMETSP1081-20130531/58993_1 /TAXON_ID=36882 /ORGANISM="Pyramimonas amylifera, Strain CCMP720" /LENGTH=215 /DNA_ID=CAMNT_0041910245 /DNA_START=269 /DNA_END=916 /DNA_ORIENTATION=+